jgi:membrane-bound ClpP family serine protease
VRAILRVHRGRVTTGREGLIEKPGVTLVNFDTQGKGKVAVHGEIWDARSDTGDLLKGDEIVVTGMNGMVLNVRKK